MNCRFLSVLGLVACLAAASQAQLTAEQKATSQRVLEKLRKVEIYNQLLPVLMTPDQIKALLPILETHRADAVKQEEFEYKTLHDYESKLDEALKDSEGKGNVPDKQVLRDGLVYFTAFSMSRKALIDDTASLLIAKMKEKLNEGQIHSAANSFDPSILLTTIKLEELTEDKKLDYWVRIVLMDNAAYDILVAMSKKKSPDVEQGPWLTGSN